MSLSFGSGRYGNQIIRNYAAHLLAIGISILKKK